MAKSITSKAVGSHSESLAKAPDPVLAAYQELLQAERAYVVALRASPYGDNSPEVQAVYGLMEEAEDKLACVPVTSAGGAAVKLRWAIGPRGSLQTNSELMETVLAYLEGLEATR